MRLNKFLAHCGVDSRRNCDELIFQGRVKVDGETNINPGAQIDEKNVEVRVDGDLVKLKNNYTYIKLHKPKGYVTSRKDPHNPLTVMTLLPNVINVVPVGRLDKDTTGVLLLTDDGDLNYRLTHPKHGVEKEYEVLLRQEPKGNIEKELPPPLVNLTEKITYAEQIKEDINEYLELQPIINSLQNSLGKRLRWQEFIEYARNSFAEAEVKLSTQKTLNLEKKYQMMYSEITNNMDIVPKLKKSEGTQDLYLTLENFYGLKDVAATTLLAESYKNALAISIYLSSVLDNILPANFIILDDVTSSFDAGCQFNLMELLKSKIARPINPNGPQIIIFSHDGLLKKYFDKISNESYWFHQKIQGLPPIGSIFTQTHDSSTLKSIAENFLNAGQIQQAEPLIRQYLEFKLLEIITKVNIKVPIDFSIRDDRKMVQNCLNEIKESIKLEKKAGTLILENSQVNDLGNTHVPSLISNWLSHYPTGIKSSFSPHVLLGVLDDIDSIADCFKYDCHCLPNTQTVRRYYKTLSSKQCNC